MQVKKVGILGAFHSTKNSEISGSKLNGTVKIPGKVFENLGIRFQCTLFVGISGIIENFVFHSQEMSGAFHLFGKTGENFLPNGTAQNFSTKKVERDERVPFDRGYSFV